MSDDFAPLEQLVDGLLDSIGSGSRRKLATAIATDLRSANARRIKANVTPDGEPMVPRRKRKGASTKQAKMELMFQRAAAPSVLRRGATSDEAWVGYPGAMARVMAVHQYGLRDHVTRDPGSPEVTYPARPLIGINEEDRTRVLHKVVAALER